MVPVVLTARGQPTETQLKMLAASVMAMVPAVLILIVEAILETLTAMESSTSSTFLMSWECLGRPCKLAYVYESSYSTCVRIYLPLLYQSVCVIPNKEEDVHTP